MANGYDVEHLNDTITTNEMMKYLLWTSGASMAVFLNTH